MKAQLNQRSSCEQQVRCVIVQFWPSAGRLETKHFSQLAVSWGFSSNPVPKARFTPLSGGTVHIVHTLVLVPRSDHWSRGMWTLGTRFSAWVRAYHLAKKSGNFG